MKNVEEKADRDEAQEGINAVGKLNAHIQYESDARAPSRSITKGGCCEDLHGQKKALGMMKD